MTYEWKPLHNAPLDNKAYRDTKPVEEREVFTGYVQGQDASEDEERFYQRVRRRPTVDWVRFQQVFIAPKGESGSIELDYMVSDSGVIYPIQIDGEIAHKTAEQKARDLFNDDVLNRHLAGQGYQLVHRIPGHEIETPEETDRYIEELFG